MTLPEEIIAALIKTAWLAASAGNAAAAEAYHASAEIVANAVNAKEVIQ